MTNLKKILIAYSSNPPIIADLSEAFAKRGIDVEYVLADKNTWFDRWVIRRLNKQLHNLRVLPKNRPLFSDHPLVHKNFRSSALAESISSFDPDVVLIVRGIAFNHEALAQAKRLFGWWVEKEERTPEALRELGLFDWYFFLAESSVEQAKASGFNNVSYQSHAVNPSRFYEIPGSAKKYDVCFVGNWSSHRQKYIDTVLKVTSNVAIYGRKWRRNNIDNAKIFRSVKGRWIDGEALNKLYNESRIVLNVTNWGAGVGKGRSGMNMRVFEVPASGAFLLTDESREMADFLTPGVHVGVFDESDLQGFEKRLRHYLEHPEEREAIAKAGNAHVRQKYTYDSAVEKFISAYDGLSLSVCDETSKVACT